KNRPFRTPLSGLISTPTAPYATITLQQTKRRDSFRYPAPKPRYKLRHDRRLLRSRCRPSVRFEQMIESVGHYPGSDQNHPKRERTHPKHRLMLTAEDRKAQHQHGRYADRNRTEDAAGHPERPRQFRLANPQPDQRRELQAQASAI